MVSSLSETPIGPLLQTVFTAILEVFLLCLAGYILASRGILDKKTQKQLNRVNVSLFTPSLLFSKVAFFLSPAKLRELWIIPIFFVLVTAFSMVVSFFLGWVFRLRRSQRNFAMAASMFMNSNSLPIALMQSLVVTVPGLKWGKDDNKNAMLGRALTYLVMYSTFGMMLRWSYGVKLLSSADTEPISRSPNPNIEIIPSAEERSSPYGLPAPTVEDPEVSEDEDGHTIVARTPRLQLNLPSNRLDQFYYSFPNSPAQSQRGYGPGRFSPTPNFSESDLSDDELPSANAVSGYRYREPTAPTSTRFQSFYRRLRYRLYSIWRTVTDFMTVPLWAALVSLIVACLRPVQHALESHVHALKNALSAAGNCSIPVTLVVLGAYFYTPKLPRTPVRVNAPTNGITTRHSSSSLFLNVKKLLLHVRDGDETHGTQIVPGETKTVAIAVLSRMVIVPLLLLPMMALSTKLSLQPVFDDPVFLLSNVLLISSPPALTLAQITQKASGDAFERLISQTIFWSYCVVTPPTIIIYIVIGLLMTKLQ